MDMQLVSSGKDSWLNKARLAVARIIEYWQDRMDYARAIKALERKEETFTLEQVKAELRLSV